MSANDARSALVLPSGDGGVVRMRGVREQLRQAEIELATAQVLERSADRVTSAPMATLLRERARQRRCRAERLRSAVGPQL